MILSDISVTRPVLAAVMSLLLLAFGLVSFERLPLREYPDIDPPVVSIDTIYPGAAANGVETRVRGIFPYRTDDDGKLTNLRGYWTMASMDFEKPS